MALAALFATLLGIVISVWLSFRSSWQDHATFLEDPEERARRIAELRGGSFGKLYPIWLERGLDLLDRRMGKPFSPKALNVCTLLALSYSYVFLFLAYAAGGPGGLGGGMTWLPPTAETSLTVRIALIAFSIAFPALTFMLTCWLGRLPMRWERRFKLSFRRRFGFGALRFELGYRGLCGFAIACTQAFVSWSSDAMSDFNLVIGGPGTILASSLVGYYVAKSVPWECLRGLFAITSGALIGSLSLGVAVSSWSAEGGALLTILVIAIVGVAAFFLVTMISLIYAGIVGIFYGYYSLGFNASFIVTTILIGAIISVGIANIILGKRRTSNSGMFGGAIGVTIVVVFLAPFEGQEDIFQNSFLFALFALFLTLPLVNGLWDFVSWWVSRSLGGHLMTKLHGKAGAGGQAWTILWHITLDLVLAAALLLSLAWFMGFAFQNYHNVGIWWGGTELAPLALSAYIDKAAAAPFSEGLWASAMLLSTLIPTLLHGTMAIAGALSCSKTSPYGTVIVSSQR